MMVPATSMSIATRSSGPATKFAQIVLAATVFAITACRGGSTGMTSAVAGTTSRVTNLHAFARLYGIVRWFHPSDAASAIDWDRFAVEGSHRIVDAPDARALRAGLTELFAPIAPTMHIVGTGKEFPNEPALHPGSITGLDVIAWQHKGYDASTFATGYVSKRRHRERTVAVPGELFAAPSQLIDATPYRGARIRLRGKLRTANHAQARLWLHVD